MSHYEGPLESPPSSTSVIACRGVSAGYLGGVVLKDISFEISAPAVYVVLGPNGAGKTTLFRTLSGILDPYEGEVLIHGTPVRQQRARNSLHYLTHMDGMPEGLTVAEALDFYARAENATSSDVARVLDQLEIRELSGQFIGRLSAGQKKRVSIARVFLQSRGIYLLDEPTANLDPKVAREIRALILELSRDRVVLYSSHNLYEAREIGRYVMAVKEGRLALFERMEDLRSSKLVLGIRVLSPTDYLASWPRDGEYYLKELAGPERVPDILHELDINGVKIREAREMNNPLEELFS